MAILCSRCRRAVEDDEVAVLCSRCKAAAIADENGVAADPPEFDHRGVRMPARARVGGIIIPQ